MAKRIRIGLQVSSIDSGYKMEVYNAITTYCAKSGYDVVLFPGGSKNSNVYAYQQTSIYSYINNKNIDALIIMSSQLLKQKKTAVPTLLPVCFFRKRSLLFKSKSNVQMPTVS